MGLHIFLCQTNEALFGSRPYWQLLGIANALVVRQSCDLILYKLLCSCTVAGVAAGLYGTSMRDRG